MANINSRRNLTNHEIVTLAVYMLGGEFRQIDTEDAAVKANSLAPGRFTWRRYPEQINIENVRAFLSDAKKPKNGAYLIGAGKEGWFLTERGVLFAKQHLARLPKSKESKKMFTPKERAWLRRERTSPLVKVTLDNRRKKIVIADNGRGMDWDGLKNFFVMHGENVDRREGRAGRGRFGTGKSAAFGVADLLRITTVRGGKRSKVELTRSDIAKMTSEDPVPVRSLEKEARTSGPNGSVVEIEGVHLRSLDQAGIIHYIERQLARWPKKSTVFVNNHEYEPIEPPVAQESRFSPEGALREQIGDVELVVKVSKAPLEDELRGISVFSNGVWHETTLAGSEGREMSQFIFGELDVPKLDSDISPIMPFDISRSMRLNPNNDLVRAIHSFIGTKVEIVRRGLLETEKKRREEEEAKN